MRNWMAMVAMAAAGCGASGGVCDGVIGVGESCDDGNDDPFDGCDCTAEPAWVAPLGERGDDGLVVLEDDGAWCWFQDERAVFAGDRLVVSSVSHAGDIQVSSFDTVTGARDHGVLHRRLERDDHDAASLLVRPDGRLTAFYTRHDGFSSMYWRTQVGGADLSIWDEEHEMEIDDDITYSNPFLLGDEGNGDPRLYLWFRGYGYGPTVASSDDLGGTWSEPLQVVSSPNTYGADGRTKQRPYVKYASNGKDTIHLIYTEGHPAEFANTSLYHLVYSHGELRRSDGTIVSSMTPAGGDPSLPPEAGTRIHDGAQSTAWVWDVALDRDEQPVVVYSAYENGTLAASYRYARFDGHAWVTSSIAPAGTALYGREKFYVGGISLDPDDTNIVYFSTNIDPSTGRSTGAHRELYRGVTRDNGASWAYAQLTHASTVENLRPVVPAHHSTATAVVWMQGTYQSYLDWDTRLVALLGDADAEVSTSARLADAPAVDNAVVTNEATSDGRAVTLAGLAPRTAYRVRLHTNTTGEPVAWTAKNAALDLDLCSKDGIVGAHRPGNSVTGADAFIDVDVTSDEHGLIELVGTSLDDRTGHRDVSLSCVDVFPQPKTVPAAGVSVAITSDRPQRADDEATVGRDRLAIDIDGLRPGATYAITVRTTATTECDKSGSRWRLDEAGRAPQVVRSFELAGGTFTFQHVASGSALRLLASDVEYRLSTNPSEIAVSDVAVEEVVP
ncbi:MAG TPA: BNR-4 repeat-containing protein [Kofleriaceae bacterium]|nr:BNR-4 repeat-containing protein [Kofleriaceae bacterium]